MRKTFLALAAVVLLGGGLVACDPPPTESADTAPSAAPALIPVSNPNPEPNPTPTSCYRTGGPAQGHAPGFQVCPQLRNGKIAFKDGNDNIWSVFPDGSDLTQLTFGSGPNCGGDFPHDEEPSWSPDGMKIVFSRTTASGQDVWVMNLDGSGQTQLTNFGDSSDPCDPSTWAENPSWSPDGQLIIFTGKADAWSPEHLFTMAANGGNQQIFTTDPNTNQSEARFSPDGSQIVFQIEPLNFGGGEMWIMDLATGSTRYIGGGSTTWENYSWSPDGWQIAFTHCCDSIFVVNPYSSSTTQLTGSGEHPAFSPDGSMIAYATGDKIWTMDANGSNQQQVNIGGLDGGEPSWQPVY